MKVVISDEFSQLISGIRLGCILAEVRVEPSSEELLAIMEEKGQQISDQLKMEEISSRPMIRAARDVYRTLGKKPGRYRPSAEALTRRVVSGKGLYHLNNVVDWLNTVSLESGFSIGGYDADKIVGTARLGVGQEGEPYEAIARGSLNIARLPLFRDDQGAFGSPTSDSTRTMVTNHTRQFLMVIFDFGGHEDLPKVMAHSITGLQEYCYATSVSSWIVE